MAQNTWQSLEEARTPEVCVIEDNESLRWLTHIVLAEAGYRVREVADGLTGYRMLRDAPEPVIALLDWTLPRMDGSELLERLAHEDQVRARRHAYIVVSGDLHGVERDYGKTLRELDVVELPKPFTITQLLEAVAAAGSRLTAA